MSNRKLEQLHIDLREIASAMRGLSSKTLTYQRLYKKRGQIMDEIRKLTKEQDGGNTP